MKKEWMLIRMLLKCGKIGKSEKKTSVAGTAVKWVLYAAMVAGMFFLGRFMAEYGAKLGGTDGLFGTIMTCAGIAAFLMTFMGALNQLYMSSDLDALVVLPLSPMQIAGAKMVSVAALPAGICLGLTIPLGIGYATLAQGLPAMFLPAMIIGPVALAAYTISAAAVLLMVIMRVFRFVRNRNVISVITALLVFGLTMAYLIMPRSDSSADLNLGGVYKSVGAVFPAVSLTIKAFSGDAVSLLIALAIGVAAVALLLLCANTIYFKAALSMTDAGGTRGKVNDSAMKKNTASAGPARTLARREFRNILRTPSLITNGYLFSIAAPLVIVVPIAVQVFDILKETMEGMGMKLTFGTVSMLVELLKIPNDLWLMIGSAFALLMAAMAVAFSSLSRFMISREGKDFVILKSLPIDMRTLVLVKRRVTMGFNGISGFLIPALCFAAAGAVKLLPVWIAAVCIVASFAWLTAIVDLCALPDVIKPNLNWESEAVVTKNNLRGLAIFGLSLPFIGGIAYLYFEMQYSWTPVALAVLLTAGPVILAVAMEVLLRRAAEKL